jgi:hypothetical protein
MLGSLMADRLLDKGKPTLLTANVIHITVWIICDYFQSLFQHTRSHNKVHKFIVVKVVHTSSLIITVFALGSYAPMPAPGPPFKTILELVLLNGLQSCCCITPDVINVIKMPSFQYFLYLQEQKKVTGG